LLYPPIFSNAVRLLRNARATLEQWQAGEVRISGAGDLELCQGVAACFSPDARGDPQLPFDTKTGRTLDTIWSEWLSFDPVRLVEQYGARLAGTQVFLSAGTNDEYPTRSPTDCPEPQVASRGLRKTVSTGMPVCSRTLVSRSAPARANGSGWVTGRLSTAPGSMASAQRQGLEDRPRQALESSSQAGM
jgi:hypothetical protein